MRYILFLFKYLTLFSILIMLLASPLYAQYAQTEKTNEDISISQTPLNASDEQTAESGNEIIGLTEESGFIYNNFISGNFRSQYEGRWAAEEEDHDLFQYLRFKTKSFYNGKITISGSGRFTADLDGHEPKDGSFRDILDTYDHSINGRLYYLYADIKDPLFKSSNLRIGRQYQYSVETVLFDGAKYEQQIGRFETYAFGGLRASHYSSTYTDTVFGGGVAVRPFIDTYTNLDYLRIEDDDRQDDEHDDEISVGLWQRLYDNINFYGRYTVLNNQPKDFLAKLSWDKAEWDLSLQLSYFRFIQSISSQSNNVSPYFQLLGSFKPFHLISVSGYKGFGKHVGISSGVDYRDVLDRDNENTFNRDYYRSYLSLTLNNILLQDFRIAFTLEYWDTEGLDHSTDFNVDANKKIGKFDIGGGSSYSLYKFHFDGSNNLATILNDEHTVDTEQRINIRTYYMRLKYFFTEKSYTSLQWTLENSDTDPETYHQVLLSYSMNF